MDEKDISGIAGAVARELAKLNTDTNAEELKKNVETIIPNVFKCPECGVPLMGGVTYCPNCGCELAWGE